LWAYLSQLRTSQARDQGITEHEIKLVALLPLTGPLAATGHLLRETLVACLSDINRQGFIYGRKLVLTVQNSGNTNEQILDSIRLINTEAKPFALLSSYLPEMTVDLEKLFMQESLPVIAPITFEINEKTDPTAPVFYFLPDHLTQAQALIEYWRTELYHKKQKSKPRLILIHYDGTTESSLADSIINRLKNDPKFKKVPLDIRKYLGNITKQELIEAKPDAILFLGGNEAFTSLQRSLEKAKLNPVLLGLFNMLGAKVLNSHDDALVDIILAAPYEIQSDSLKRLANKLDQYSVKIENPGLQSLACSSVNVTAQALKQSGKHLTRSKLLKNLEEINGFQTGITPPLYYSQSNHHARPGAYLYIVSDPLDISITPIGWYPLIE
jgi:ABC-type branched-subunit amino acid transport system substrate-binding protein